MENVAKMLGHSSTRMTQHYAKVLDQSIMEDMMNVDSKFGDLKMGWEWETGRNLRPVFNTNISLGLFKILIIAISKVKTQDFE